MNPILCTVISRVDLDYFLYVKKTKVLILSILRNILENEDKRILAEKMFINLYSNSIESNKYNNK